MELTKENKSKVYERKVDLLDALSRQSAKVEELAYFFNQSSAEIEGILELECIDAKHLRGKLTKSKQEQLSETRIEFMCNLQLEEGWSTEEVCLIFNLTEEEAVKLFK